MTPGRRLRRDLVIGLGVAAAVLLGVVLISGRRTPGAAGSMAGRLAPAADRSREAEAAGWRAAAFAYAAAGRDDEAVAAHLRALTAVPGRSDPLLFPWVDDLLTRKQVGAVELLPLMGGQGRAMLVEQASRGRTPALRARARDLAADNSVSGGVDLVGSFSLDLAQGASCRERREAIPRLRALRDKRAVPALKRARGRSGGFLGLSQVNSCLDKDAAEAIDFLQALP